MDSHIEKRKQTFKVRDINISVIVDVRIDNNSNEILFDYDLDNQAINKAFSKYRQINHMVYPEEIVSFRKKYKLSQESLAKLLNISSRTLSRYEKGSIPTENINKSLKKLMSDGDNIEEISNSEKIHLSD